MERFEERFGRWIVENRWLLIILTLIFLAVSASGMRFITFQNDSRMFFSDDNPQLKALEALENTYTKSDNVMFVIAPKDGNVFTAKTLDAIVELTELSWQIEHSSRVDSISNFQHTKVDEDDLIVRDLVQSASPYDNDLMIGMRLILNDPEGSDLLVGLIHDVDSSSSALIMEGSRRLNDNIRATIELWSFINETEDDPGFYRMRDDDFVKVEAFYYF